MQHNDRLNDVNCASLGTSKFYVPRTYYTSPFLPSLITGTELPSTFGVIHSEGTHKNNRKKNTQHIKITRQEEEVVFASRGKGETEGRKKGQESKRMTINKICSSGNSG